MPPPALVAEYVAAIAHELSFDPALARRVSAEVEDHLLEALGDQPAASSGAPEELIAAFGQPRELACEFASAWAFALARRMTAVLAVAVLGVFVVMNGRSAWYQWVEWRAGKLLQAVYGFGLPVNRVAFALALALSFAALLSTVTRGAPLRVDESCCRRIRGSLRLSTIALLVLFAAIAAETVLMSARFAEVELNRLFVLPALTLAVEALLAAVCAVYLIMASRRLARALALVEHS